MRSKYHLAIAKIAHKSSRTNTAESGFALPLALGMGLIMIIVAASTIGRSQSDRATTNFQKESTRALGVSEAGLLRVQLFLDRHKLLATQNLDQWVDTLNTLPSEQANCGSLELTATKQQAEVFKNHNWINLDNNDPNKGRYRIIDYQHQASVGTLTLAGEVNNYNTNLNSSNSSNSTLSIQIPTSSEDAKTTPPVLWAQTFKLSLNQPINGQIRAVACPQITASNPDGVSGIDRTNITAIDGQITGQIIADPFTQIPKVKQVPIDFILIPAITSSIKLPRPESSGDSSKNNEYNYLVDVDPSNGYSIKLKDNSHIEINSSVGTSDIYRKVNIYLKGNIDLAGGKITNDKENTPLPHIYGSEQTTKLIVKDNAKIGAFIHAPFADAQNLTTKSVRLNSGIVGAVWVKSWDSATNKGQISITQSGNWVDNGITKIEQPPQLSLVRSWRRVESESESDNKRKKP